MHSSPHGTLPARVLLVGAGRVGTAVTHLLSRRGVQIVGVASRSSRSAERAATFLKAPVGDLDALPASDLVVIGAVDGGIEPLAQRIAAGPSAAARVIHLSGVSGSAPLAAIVEAGGVAWALHPVQACPDVPSALERLPGSAWGVTVSDDLKGAFHLVQEGFGGLPVEVPEDARAMWHAASVMTSNGISALLSLGEEILRATRVESPVDVLTPLAAGTVANARAGGGGSATLTGPIIRGEADTVGKHLAALGGAPELQARYREVARMILEAADATGRLDPAARQAIEELL